MKFNYFRGGVADNQIARIQVGSTVLRVLWFANGKHRCERFTIGDWEKVTPEIAKDMSLCNFRLENWFREHTDLLD